MNRFLTVTPLTQLMTVGVAVMLLAACNATSPTEPGNEQGSACDGGEHCKENEGVDRGAQLLEQRELWQITAPDRYFYTYVNEQTGDGQSDSIDKYYRRVSVASGRIEASVLTFDEYFLRNGDFPAQSVDSLFELVESAVQGDDPDWSVEYDPEYGYPVRLQLGNTTHILSEFSLEQGPLDTYYQKRALWLSADLSRYSFELERECDCAANGRFEVTFAYGDSSVIDVQTQQPPSAEVQGAIESSVEELFALVKERVLSRDSSVVVEYHEQYGFPSRIETTSSDVAESVVTVLAFKRYNHQELAKLESRRQQWRDLNLQNYSYRYEYECYIFCRYLNYEVTVENGEVVSAVSSNPPETPSFKTIEEMFDLAEEYIARGWQEDDIGYHPDYFFPVELEYTGMSHTGDDDYWYTISEFTLL